MCFSLTADSTLLTAFPIASTCKFVNRLTHNENKYLSFIEEEIMPISIALQVAVTEKQIIDVLALDK